MSNDPNEKGKKVARLGRLNEMGALKSFPTVKQEAATAPLGPAPSPDVKPNLKDKDTTSGGVRKVKFTPKIPAVRRVKDKKKPEESSANETPDDSGEMDVELKNRIVQQNMDESGRVGRTVQWGDKGKQAGGPRLRQGGAFQARVALGAGGLAGATKDESAKKTGIFGQSQVKLDAEDLLEDKSRYYPTVLREQSADAALDRLPTAAEALHLNCDESEGRISILQLPSHLPVVGCARAKEEGGEGSEAPAGEGAAAAPLGAGGGLPGGGWPNALAGLPAGKIGKLRVYASGAVKMVIGDVQFDVAPGTTIGCAQQIAAIDSNNAKATFLGDIQQRAVVTPDIVHLLSHISTRGAA